MKYTVAEFRKNTREILNAVDQGADVMIQRYDKLYSINPVNNDTDARDAFAYAIGVDPAIEGSDRTIILKPRAMGKTAATKKFIEQAQKIKDVKVPKGVAPVESCPHGFAKGMCKKTECNRKYAK